MSFITENKTSEDIDGFVVYIDGKIHPKGTGFATRKDVIDRCIREGIWK